MTKTIALCSPTKGTGKTTTAICLGYGLARDGKKVLMVDLDAQGDMTAGLGYCDYNMIDDLESTIASALRKLIGEDSFDPRECIFPITEGIDLIPANIKLTDLKTLLLPVMQRELVLRKYLTMISSGYDYIIIDCPPSSDIFTINALTAADELIIPVSVGRFSQKSLNMLLRTYNSILHNELNPCLRLKGILLTLVRAEDSFTAAREAKIRECCQEANLPVFDTCIPFSGDYEHHTGVGMSTYVLDGAEKNYRIAYENLIKEESEMNKLNENLFNTMEEPERPEDALTSLSANNIVNIDIDCLNLLNFRNDKNIEAIAISIKEFGLLEPIIVRRSGNGYEILWGHNHAAAAKKAGLTKIPCTVVDFDDEKAYQFIYDFSKTIRKPLPSENAKCIHLEYEIFKKRKGSKHDGGGRVRDIVAERTGFSPSKVQRYLRLYDLGDQLMDAVDSKFIQETSAIDKVYPMRIPTRNLILARISSHGTVFSDKCLSEILSYDRLGKITPDLFTEIINRYENEKKRKK